MLRVIIGGILSLPALLVMLVSSILTMILALPGLFFLKYDKAVYVKRSGDRNGKSHAIISGGSSGIGQALAMELLSHADSNGIGKITILARDPDKLKETKELLVNQKTKNDSSSSTPEIETVAVDVMDYEKLQSVAKQVCSDSTFSTTFLFCCAGMSFSMTLNDFPIEKMQCMDVNYMGTVFTVKAFLPHIKQGTIQMTSSAGGQIGVYGLCVYAGTKFALRGFAEALHMELLDRPIHVQLVFPPDTDTPGYAEENKTKPKACKLISEQAGLLNPTQVGSTMAKQALKNSPPFTVWFGLDGWMLNTLTAGMSPVSSMTGAISQVSLMSLLRLVSLFYLNDFWSIIQKCHGEERKK